MTSLRPKVLSTTVNAGIFAAAAMGALIPGNVAAFPIVAAQTVFPSPATPNPTARPRLAVDGYLHLARSCNPCAAKNPCVAAETCNPCNPCAAAASASTCTVPRLMKPAKTNPCAAKKGCNPCGAANPCSPSGPCGAAPVIELSVVEANAAYACIKDGLATVYSKSGLAFAKAYQRAKRVNTTPYQSTTHGNRFVSNYSDTVAYGKFEDGGVMPKGTLIAKDSFIVSPSGDVSGGPLFLMEKMGSGFNDDTGDWRYTMVSTHGKIVGTTGAEGDSAVQFCADCHAGAEDQDHLFFLPETFRK